MIITAADGMPVLSDKEKSYENGMADAVAESG
jgi:hypothetical protein